MKIAQIAPIAERVPPKRYGGTERVVYCLTEHLVRRGHEVTLFASGDSATSAKLVSVFPRGIREAKVHDPHGINEWTLLNIGLAYKMQDEFDIIHDHNSPISLPAANIAITPTVFTIHSPITPSNKKLFQALDKPNLVSISKSQIEKHPYLNFVGTVHNGLDLENYPFGRSNDGYLLFVGRISPEKGVHYAIEVAQYLNLPLIIVAKIDDVDRDYFTKFIEPKLSEQIRWVGEKDEKERNDLYSNALAFLHPVTWPEPFGLTMIEAMACGTPVIAFNQGSVPELVVHGRTGFIARDLEEMIESVLNIDKIDRRETRSHALKNFNAARMVTSYEAIYQQILNQTSKKTPQYQRSFWS